MTITYTIYAFENLDGICSAAIVLRWFRLKNYNYKLNFINYRNAEKTFREMCRLKRSLLFILDFPPEHIEKLDEKLKILTARHNKIIYWNTHLSVDEDKKTFIKQYSSFFDNHNNICSAEMVWKRFLPNDKIAIELKDLAHDIEFWKKKDERSEKLTDLIASNYNMVHLVEDLSKGIFWSDKFEQLHKSYIKKKEKSFKDLVKSMVVHYYSPHNFGYGFASTLISSADAGQKLLEDPKIDVSVVIYRDGRLSLRRGENVNLDLTEIARLFDGGGHPYAAGGRFTDVMMPIGSGNRFKIAVEKIDKRLREFFKENAKEKQKVLV